MGLFNTRGVAGWETGVVGGVGRAWLAGLLGPLYTCQWYLGGVVGLSRTREGRRVSGGRGRSGGSWGRRGSTGLVSDRGEKLGGQSALPLSCWVKTHDVLHAEVCGMSGLDHGLREGERERGEGGGREREGGGREGGRERERERGG